MDKTKFIRGINTISNICKDHPNCNHCPFFFDEGGGVFCIFDEGINHYVTNFMEDIKKFTYLKDTTITPFSTTCNKYKQCENCSLYLYDKNYDEERCMTESCPPAAWDIELIKYFIEKENLTNE